MFDNDKHKKLRISILAAALAALPLGAGAAGLGKLTVVSALGQPLKAELDISASKEELNSLAARVASADAYRQANIEYSGIVSTLRFTLDKRPNGQAYFRISSERPISDPFLDLLVELSWSSGRLVREYTFLLDPPELKPAEAPVAPVSSPVATPTRATPKVETAKPAEATTDKKAEKPTSAAKKQSAAPSAPKAESADKGGDTRAVKKGDTLGKIANEVRPEGVSLDQMLVALFRGNEDAFDGANMNRLKAGKILNVPDRDTIVAVDAGEARKVVVAQSADFEAYKRKLAGAVAAAPAKSEAPSQAASGKITPKVEDKAPAVGGKDKLQVSRTEGGKEGSKGKAAEDLVAKEKALQEAKSRIAELEGNVAKLQKLAELKSQAGADLQKQAAKPAEVKKPEPTPAPTPAAKPAEPPKAAPAPAKPEAAALAKVEPPKAEAPKAEPAKAEPPKPAEAPKPDAAKPEEKPAEAAKAAEAAKPAEPPPPPKKKPLPPPPPPPEPDFMEENGALVAGGGGVLALLAGYFGFTAWKRRKAAAAAPESHFSEPPVSSGSEFGPASEDHISGPASDFGAAGDDLVGGVDPIREAETYLAYGRDAQAEEILVDALRSNPAQPAVQLKLLEIYASRRAVNEFNQIANDLHQQTGGSGEDWEKAAGLGRSVDPANPLYGAGEVLAAAPAAMAEVAGSTVIMAAPIVEEAPAEPVAEVTEAELPGSLDFDLDLGAAETEAPASAAAEPVAAPAEEAAGLDFDLDLGEAAPAAAAEAPAPAAEEEPAGLDFDLDLGTAESAPEPAAAPAVETAAAAEEAGGLDFDLGMDETPAPAAPAVEAPMAVADDAGLGMDFDLDIGGAAPAAPEAPAPAAVEEAPAAAGNMMDFDLDLGAAPEVAAQVEQAAAAAAEPESSGLDFDFDLGEAAPAIAAAEAPAPALDLAGIDLDLGDTAVPDLDLSAGESSPPLAMPSDNPEVATKLELAQAYEEMGDKEGAKELLQEVLSEGSEAQQAVARDKLAKLG